MLHIDPGTHRARTSQMLTQPTFDSSKLQFILQNGHNYTYLYGKVTVPVASKLCFQLHWNLISWLNMLVFKNMRAFGLKTRFLFLPYCFFCCSRWVAYLIPVESFFSLDSLETEKAKNVHPLNSKRFLQKWKKKSKNSTLKTKLKFWVKW